MSEEKKKVRYIDPPSGWKYGFPAILPEGKDAKELLLEKGYPKKDIEFALSYCRMWEEDET